MIIAFDRGRGGRLHCVDRLHRVDACLELYPSDPFRLLSTVSGCGLFEILLYHFFCADRDSSIWILNVAFFRWTSISSAGDVRLGHDACASSVPVPTPDLYSCSFSSAPCHHVFSDTPSKHCSIQHPVSPRSPPPDPQ